MPRTWRLDFNNGDFLIVTSPSILSKKGEFHSRMVGAYHRELLERLYGKNVWSADRTELESIASALFAEFGLYYQKIGELFTPKINPLDLTTLSRHAFYISTEAVEHPETNEVMRGLSGIEQLMGYAYTKRVDRAEPRITTGDSELDVLTDALLTFKRKGLELAQLLSTEDLALVTKQAIERMKPQEEAEAVTTVEAPFEDDEMFLQSKEAIVQGLERLGVMLPRGF